MARYIQAQSLRPITARLRPLAQPIMSTAPIENSADCGSPLSHRFSAKMVAALSPSPIRSMPSAAFRPVSSYAASIPCCSRFQNSCSLTNHASCSFIRLHRPCLGYPHSRPGLCLAASPGPGEPGPPPGEGPLWLKGANTAQFLWFGGRTSFVCRTMKIQIQGTYTNFSCC